MARLPRLVVPAQPHYVMQRSSDGVLAFRDASDYQQLLHWLREASRKFKVALHAYVCMPEYWSLLASPSDGEGLGRMMQWVGRYYVPYYNRKYGRAGGLWQGRYKASVLDAQEFLLPCMRYLELLPVQDRLVAQAIDYPWSSLAHHLGISQDALVTDHPLYWSLGNTPFEREAAYKAFIEQAVGSRELALWQSAGHRDWPLGTEKFKLDLERRIKRRVRPARRGRPPKPGAEKSS